MNYFIEEKLKVVANHAQTIDVATNAILTAVKEIFVFSCGEKYASMRSAAAETRDRMQTLGLGFGTQKDISKKSLIEEIKEMLIELNVKGTCRIRPNGLIELRNKNFGSLYARSMDELRQKLTTKINELIQKNKETVAQKAKVPLLSEFCSEYYIPYKRQELKPSSIPGLENDLKTIFKAEFDLRLNKYTSANIEQFLQAIPQSRKRQKLRGTINNIFNYAKMIGKIKTNPCDNVTRVKHKEENGKAMPFKLQASFFAELYSNPKVSLTKKLYLSFVYLTGLRRAEALGLKAEHVDYDGNTLHILGTKSYPADRYIPLTPLVKKLLDLAAPTKDGFIFPLSTSAASHAMDRCKGYKLHDLRHTYGTIAVCVQKLDAKTVSLLLGHSTVALTLSTYTHPEQLDRGLFLNGSIDDNEKLRIMRAKHAEILQLLSNLLDSIPQTYHQKT